MIQVCFVCVEINFKLSFFLGLREYAIYTIPHSGTAWQSQHQPTEHQPNPSKFLSIPSIHHRQSSRVAQPYLNSLKTVICSAYTI